MTISQKHSYYVSHKITKLNLSRYAVNHNGVYYKIIELQKLVYKLIDFFKENSSSKRSEEIFGYSRLKEDLNLDNLDFVELVMKLEDEYVIKIQDEEANKLKTIEDRL